MKVASESGRHLRKKMVANCERRYIDKNATKEDEVRIDSGLKDLICSRKVRSEIRYK